MDTSRWRQAVPWGLGHNEGCSSSRCTRVHLHHASVLLPCYVTKCCFFLSFIKLSLIQHLLVVMGFILFCGVQHMIRLSHQQVSPTGVARCVLSRHAEGEASRGLNGMRQKHHMTSRRCLLLFIKVHYDFTSSLLWQHGSCCPFQAHYSRCVH